MESCDEIVVEHFHFSVVTWMSRREDPHNEIIGRAGFAIAVTTQTSKSQVFFLIDYRQSPTDSSL